MVAFSPRTFVRDVVMSAWDRGLYTVRTENVNHRIVRFDGYYNVLRFYYVFHHKDGRHFGCTCQNGQRVDCIHRLVLRKFKQEKRVDSGWFYDHEHDVWERPLNDPIRLFKQKAEKARENSNR